MPICRGSYIVFNIDFDVIEHSKKKVIPGSSGGANTAIKFFLRLCYLFVLFFFHIKICIVSFSKFPVSKPV